MGEFKSNMVPSTYEHSAFKLNVNIKGEVVVRCDGVKEQQTRRVQIDFTTSILLYNMCNKHVSR